MTVKSPRIFIIILFFDFVYAILMLLYVITLLETMHTIRFYNNVSEYVSFCMS